MVRPLGSGRPNSDCQRRRSAAPDNDRTRSISASTAAASTNRCSMSGRLRLDHAIDPLAVRLLGLQGQPELLAHHPGQKAAHRMGLPAGRRDDGRNSGALRPVQHPRYEAMISVLESFYRETYGALGNGMKVFIFDAGDVGPCKPGQLSVLLANETYTWDTPFPGCQQ